MTTSAGATKRARVSSSGSTGSSDGGSGSSGSSDGSIDSSSSATPPSSSGNYLGADARARIAAFASLPVLFQRGPDVAASVVGEDDEVWRLLAQREWPVLRRLRLTTEGLDEKDGASLPRAWVEEKPAVGGGAPPLCLPSGCTWKDLYCAMAVALHR